VTSVIPVCLFILMTLQPDLIWITTAIDSRRRTNVATFPFAAIEIIADPTGRIVSDGYPVVFEDYRYLLDPLSHPANGRYDLELQIGS